MPNGTRDIAAFQMEAVHEDLAAGFFKVFSDLGLGCTAYFNQRINTSRGDFFDVVSHPNVEVDYPLYEGRPSWDAVAERVKQQAPKALYFNTLQRDGIATWGDRFDLPVLAVVHNPYLFQASGPCRELAKSGRLDMFGLAPHVVSKLIECVPELEGRAHLHLPYVWMPDEADAYTEAPEILDIVVPGAVNFENRDFEGLLNHLKSSDVKGQRPFKLSILAGGPDRAKLEGIIESDGLQRYFDLAPLHPETRRVPHSAYLQRLYSCHAILPLLPVGRPDYIQSKVTTGVMAGLGIGRPIISGQMVASAYGYTPIEIPDDRPFDLAVADLSPSVLAHRRAESLSIRAAALKHNHATIKRVLEKARVVQ